MTDEILDGDYAPRLRSESPANPSETQLPDRRTPARQRESAGLHLLDFVKVLYKRRWLAATVFLIVVVGVTVRVFSETPIYEARTRLLIEAESPNVVSFKAVIEEDHNRQDYYQTQYSMLQSRALARRVLEQMNLWRTAPFVVNRNGARLADSTTAGTPSVAETAAETRAISVFLAHLTVAPVRNSRLVDLRYQLPDPQLATQIVNTLARNYIDQNLEYKFMASKEANDWLAARLGEQRKQVQEAEAKLQRYREAHDTISLQDRESIVVQKLTELNAALTQAKTDQIQKEAIYNQLQSLRGDVATLDTFPAILNNGFIQQQKAELAQLQSQYGQLGEKLGPNHPDMVKIRSAVHAAQSKLDAEISKIIDAAKNESLAALAKERVLTEALNAQKTDALAMNRNAIEYNVLDREIQSARQIYDNLLQRMKETGLSSELKTSNIRIVDRAEIPLGPVSPRKALMLALALIGGIFLAGGVVFFFEYMDNRLKTPDDIRVHLGLSSLGLLPALAKSSSYPLVSNGVPPNFSEAFRAIRTNVLFASAQEGSRSLVVTSTAPNEGKSLVASNLAVSLAQAGQRVLVIDADLRKPKMHAIFSLPQEPGLSNLLVGEVKASESVQKSGTAGLWVLPAGRVPPNPAELVGSPRFQTFLASLWNHFDWIIIDSPPVIAVTDAALIAHGASGVVFVVGAEMTSRYAAQHAVDQLDRVQAKIVGAILNRVDLEHQGYYYSQYYRREYAQYYSN